ncbi:hypothetical protein NPIL_306781 [Nephila pilipes]|uniref:Uncharacterized protein n=1 Tax=Nephila pilipes TaxID=299642 RepID=A0A8X6MQB3_NEPPI|nr:hypothetical protein NPIL_306781 [Nephila pilipes]
MIRLKKRKTDVCGTLGLNRKDSTRNQKTKKELTEKLIAENHRDEFSAKSGRPSISPSPLRLTSRHGNPTLELDTDANSYRFGSVPLMMTDERNLNLIQYMSNKTTPQQD